MLLSYKRGQSSVILRVKVLNSSVTTGAGLTGLLFSSTGLIISTIVDNEATATAYTAAGSTTETITTLGTYAAPTATKCRFKEVDATNHKGVYEIQLADARFAVASAKSLLVSISGATNAAETDVVIPLTDIDPYDGVRAGLTALPNAAAAASGGLIINGSNSGTVTLAALTVTGATTLTGAVSFGSTWGVTGAVTFTGGLTSAIVGNVTGNLSGSVGSVTGAVGSVTGAVGSVTAGVTVTTNNDKTGYALTVTPPTAATIATAVLTTAMTESYAADGDSFTLAQGLYQIHGYMTELNISGTTGTIKKLDGVTTAYTVTYNDATNPSAVTRAT